jgi:hypothetical protein
VSALHSTMYFYYHPFSFRTEPTPARHYIKLQVRGHIRRDAIFRQSDLGLGGEGWFAEESRFCGDHTALVAPPYTLLSLCISPGLFCSARESITLAAPAILSFASPEHPPIVCATPENRALHKGLCHRQIFFLFFQIWILSPRLHQALGTLRKWRN